MGFGIVAAGAGGSPRVAALGGAVLAAIPALFMAGAAAAHSWYDLDCCSAKDCAPIPAAAVTVEPEGYRVTLRPGDHFMVTAPLTAFFAHGNPNLRPSQDGDWHACVIPGFAPPAGIPEGYTPGWVKTDPYIRCLYVPGAGA